MLNFVFYCKNIRLRARNLLIAVGTVWEENSLPTSQRKHPHQKPRELIGELITATTQERELIVDPCADSLYCPGNMSSVEKRLFRVWFDLSVNGRIYCQVCQKKIENRRHHGVIKNHNNPSFWGLETKEKILCSNCLASKKENMPSLMKGWI
jgi:DNA modification methylase